MKAIRRIVAALLLLSTAGPSAAQTGYPDQAVRILVGFTPGVAPDIVARVLAGADIMTPARILTLPTLAEFRSELAALLAYGQSLGLVRRDLDPAVAALGLETVVLNQVGYLVASGMVESHEPDARWAAVVSLLDAALRPLSSP